MSQPPRDPREAIVPRSLLRRILAESTAIAAGTLAAYVLGVMRHGRGPVAQSMAFASLVGAQLLHVPFARSGTEPVTSRGRPRNRALVLGVTLSAALQLAALFVPPLRGALGGVALGLTDLSIAALGAVVPLLAIQMQRRVRAARPA
jgi:Ca2+-transporting ATPase